MKMNKIANTHEPINAIRLLLCRVLQDIVDAISYREDAPRWTIQVRAMRLGRKRWERKVYRQTTLGDYFDLEIGEPEEPVVNTLSYTVNPRYLTDEYVTQIYEEILEDMTQVV